MEGHGQPRCAAGAAGNAEGGYNYIGNAAGALSFLGWTSGAPQQAGMWFQIELPAPQMLTEIQFTSSADRRPRAARRRLDLPAALSGPGVGRWHHVERAVAEGQGAPGTTAITFAPVSAKFVRITQTAAVDNAPRMVDAAAAPV